MYTLSNKRDSREAKSLFSLARGNVDSANLTAMYRACSEPSYRKYDNSLEIFNNTIRVGHYPF